jgi:hypothetical protein
VVFTTNTSASELVIHGTKTMKKMLQTTTTGLQVLITLTQVTTITTVDIVSHTDTVWVELLLTNV